jgi:hypothetical protein
MIHTGTMASSTEKDRRPSWNPFGRTSKTETLQHGKAKKAKTYGTNGHQATVSADAGFPRPNKPRSAKTSLNSAQRSSSASPEPTPDSYVAIKKLQESINMLLSQNTIGFRDTNYLPSKYYPDLIYLDSVRVILPGASSELVNFILTKATKVFAITSLVISGPEQLHIAMNAFFRHDFTDKEGLPVRKITNQGKCRMFDRFEDTGLECVPACSLPEGNVCPHDWRANVFHHEFWDRNTFDIFYIKQWPFLVEQFKGDRFQRSLEVDRILPFTPPDPEQQNDSGKLGKVNRTTMLKFHQDVIDPKVLYPLIRNKYEF